MKKGYIDLRCIFYRISLFFFAKCDLVRLQNMPTEFCEAVPGCCGTMLELGENRLYCFLADFFTFFFFLLNVI